MIASFHSPVQPWHDPLFAEKRVSVFVKRDDMLHPFVSGNKFRKLRYLLDDAQAKGCTRLVTFGGAWSNHLLATACAAAASGFSSTGFVRGEPADNLVTGLCRLFGMELRFVSRDEYRDKESLFRAHFPADEQAFFIDEGGAGPLAARGCAEMIGELDAPYDHLFCAAGTGTTAAGFLNGIRAAGLPTHLHVVPVLKGAEFLEKQITSLLENHAAFTLHSTYHFGGYAKTDATLTRFIREFCAATGMLIEPVYTGKLFFAVRDLVSRDQFAPGTRILLVHTGGLTGIAGKFADFSNQ